MKKILLVCALIGLVSTTASAQMLRFGVKGGVTMLSTDIKGVREAGDEKWSEFKSKDLGWNLGILARVQLPLTNLYVQPELVYNHAGYKIFDPDGRTSNVRYGNLELPVLLGFKILFLRANVGPTFTLATIEKNDVYKVQRPDVGFQAGAGFTIQNVTFDVRYHGYFNKKWKEVDFSDIGDRIKANDGYWGISLGYLF